MRRTIGNIVLLTAVGILVKAAAGQTPDNARPRTISITGEGIVSAPPDMAMIQTGVVTQAETASQALEQNNQAMQAVMEILEQHDIPQKDIQTSHLSVQPVHPRDEQGRTQTEIIAYRVENQVQAEIHKLPQLGTILDSLVKAGSNQLSGIKFGVKEETELLNQARRQAMQNAKNNALVLADAAGVELGDLQQISESSQYIPHQRGLAIEAVSRDVANVPIATGEQDFRVSVHAVYSLEGNSEPEASERSRTK